MHEALGPRYFGDAGFFCSLAPVTVGTPSHNWIMTLMASRAFIAR
jgi:hypothetical protein